MLPGKTYTAEDLVRVAKRRIWVLLVPFAVASAGAAVYARMLPDNYRSSSVILVVPQRIPESYVRSTVTTPIEDRLQAIQQELYSRVRLERIIRDFNLYPEARERGLMQDVVERMKDEIDVDILRGDAFSVSYVGRDPQVVAKVTSELATLFINESLRDRSRLAQTTNQFLETELREVERRLQESEAKKAAFELQYAGELPSQLSSNMQAASNVQMQIQNLVDSLGRDQDRKLQLERTLADVEAQPAALAEPVPVQPTPEALASARTLQDQLTAARALLSGYQLRWTDDHPEVRKLRLVVEDLEKKVEAEALRAPVSGPAPVSAAEQLRQKRIADLRSDIQTLTGQIAQKQATEVKLREAAAEYQRRIEATPTRETQMYDLTRDYNILSGRYSSLLQKFEDAKMAFNLEEGQRGEQFKLLDPAQVAQRPFSPNRPFITSVGVAVGLGVGVALIALLEIRDSTFKTDDDVAGAIDLPVLAVVPFMQSAAERRRAFWRRLAMHVGLGSVVSCCLLVLAYTLVR
jgi:polysaccharide chain length determinant protein (PEP-CTERM system associated)